MPRAPLVDDDCLVCKDCYSLQKHKAKSSSRTGHVTVNSTLRVHEESVSVRKHNSMAIVPGPRKTATVFVGHLSFSMLADIFPLSHF